jgi:hypothetical protein
MFSVTILYDHSKSSIFKQYSQLQLSQLLGKGQNFPGITRTPSDKQNVQGYMTANLRT